MEQEDDGKMQSLSFLNVPFLCLLLLCVGGLMELKQRSKKMQSLSFLKAPFFVFFCFVFFDGVLELAGIEKAEKMQSLSFLFPSVLCFLLF